MKNYKVWNESECEWMEVSQEWMKGVNVKNAEEFNYSSATEKLEVIYKNGNTVYYENIHGTWGFPCTFK